MVKWWCALISLLLLSAVQAQPQATQGLQGYKFGPGDSIKISVYLEPDLSVTAEISQQGFIDMPLLGSIRLTGHTQQSVKHQTRRPQAARAANSMLRAVASKVAHSCSWPCASTA